MSKPTSGLFKNTIGFRMHPAHDFSRLESRILEQQEKERIVPHPTKRKQMSSKRKKTLRTKIKNRTITKAEYKDLEWNRRLSLRRNKGIVKFWYHEKQRLNAGLPGTRNWTEAQKRDILNNKRPSFKGKTLKSHHMFSVKEYPHLANRGDFIYPATDNEHFNGWHGGNYSKSLPGRQIKTIKDF